MLAQIYILSISYAASYRPSYVLFNSISYVTLYEKTVSRKYKVFEFVTIFVPVKHKEKLINLINYRWLDSYRECYYGEESWNSWGVNRWYNETESSCRW